MARSFEKPFQAFADKHRKTADEASTIRKHLVAASGEFVGTLMFLMLGFAGHQMAAGQAAEKGPNGQNSSQTVIYISLAYGFSLLISVWALYRVSGGLFNPAVTLGLCTAGGLPWIRGLFLLPAQLIGAIVAAALIQCMLPGPITAVQTTLAPGMSQARGVFFEMFMTAFFVFVILMLAVEKSKDTFLAPLGIGLALFVCEIAGGSHRYPWPQLRLTRTSRCLLYRSFSEPST